MEIIFALCREKAKSAKFIALKIFALYGSLANLTQDTSLDIRNQLDLVKYKYPYLARDMTVEMAYKHEEFSDTVILKQITQGQMAICIMWAPVLELWRALLSF